MKKVVFCFAIIAALIGTQAFATSTSKTVVLVHGANFSPEAWSPVIPFLSAAGVTAIAANLYQSSDQIDLHTAASRLCFQITQLKTPVTIVAHSQGGAIASEATGICGSSIAQLVYLTAVLPLPGEQVFADLSDLDNANYAKCGYLDQPTGEYRLLNFEGCWSVFMQDVPQTKAQSYYQYMRAEPGAIGNSTAAYDVKVLNQIPKFFISTAFDKIITPETQAKIMKKAKFEKTFLLQTSHAPFLSQPEQLSQMIESIVNSGR